MPARARSWWMIGSGPGSTETTAQHRANNSLRYMLEINRWRLTRHAELSEALTMTKMFNWFLDTDDSLSLSLWPACNLYHEARVSDAEHNVTTNAIRVVPDI